MRITAVESSLLSVPLREPFVIASARMDATRAVLVTVELEDERTGRRALGLGEAAALPPVTDEDQPDLMVAIDDAAQQLCGRVCAKLGDLSESIIAKPVARAALECAVLDAWARLEGVPLCR